jgi:hypothetical protein
MRFKEMNSDKPFVEMTARLKHRLPQIVCVKDFRIGKRPFVSERPWPSLP